MAAPLRAGFSLGAAVVLWTTAGMTNGTLELIGAPTSGNGLSSRVLGRNAETAFFNPALLTDAASTTEVGYFVLHVSGDIRLHPRPGGVDVPESVYDARLPNPDGTTRRLELRPRPTALLTEPRADTPYRETTSYVTVGVIRRLFTDRVVLGFYGLLPMSGFQQQAGFYADEREQYFSNQLNFELQGDRGLVTFLSMALAARVARWLSVGAGMSLSTLTRTRTWVYIPDTGEQRNILINPEVEVYTAFSPYFAAVTRPSRQLRLTTTLHLPAASDTTGENRARFWTDDLYEAGEDYVAQEFEFSQAYQPLRAGIGLAWLSEELTEGLNALQLGAGATLHRWSTYRDRHGERPADRWRNTISLNLGGASALSERQWLSLDLAYFPTPVPDQIGQSNYVDNSRVAASAAFETPLPWAGLRLGAYLHGQLLIAREVTKQAGAPHPVTDEVDDSAVDLVSGEPLAGAGGLQTNNPGYPGFSSRGYMVGAGVALRLPQ